MSTADKLHPESAVPEQPTETPDRPEGPIVAAVLAGGVGCFAMGVFTTVSEASTTVADDWLTWSDDVGPLSGKTIMTVIVWLVSWAILYAVYRNRRAETRRALIIALVLIGLGVIGTFPTFFQLFTPE
jgi:heme/copper-type cytochrome/quinol oxidase subunit 3